jgi:hypothetical protein
MKKQTLVGLMLNICLENSANIFYSFEMKYTRVGTTRDEDMLEIEIYRRRRLWFKVLSFIFGWLIPWPENDFGSPKMSLVFQKEEDRTPVINFYMEKKIFGKTEQFNEEITIDNGERIGNFNEDVEPNIFNPVFYSEKAFCGIIESLKQRGFEFVKI